MNVECHLLRIEVDDPFVSAYEFGIGDSGLIVTQLWHREDEIFGDGVSIQIPTGVWRQALPWINERMK